MMDEKETFCDEGTKNTIKSILQNKISAKTHFEKLKLFAEKKT